MVVLKNFRAVASIGPGFVVEKRTVSKSGREDWVSEGFFLKPEQAIAELATHCKKESNRDALNSICARIKSVKVGFNSVTFEAFDYEGFRVRKADSKLYTVERYKVTGEGKEVWNSMGWYNQISVALGRMLDMLLHESNVSTLGEIREKVGLFSASVEAAQREVMR
jgi:hypothetical protein